MVTTRSFYFQEIQLGWSDDAHDGKIHRQSGGTGGGKNITTGRRTEKDGRTVRKNASKVRA